MTSPYLFSDIKDDEALRLEAYPDPRLGWDKPTIGYGHTGREVHRGLVITQEEANTFLAHDIAAVVKGLDSAIPWWRSLDDLRQDVVVNMGFNLGIHGLLEFHTFLELLERHDYAGASLDLRGTEWYKQVPRRAIPLAKQLASGKHVPIN